MFSTGHRLLAVCLFAASLFTISASAQQNCGPLVDSLGTFSASSTYSVFGAGALTVSRYQAVGPRIILDQPKVITEIGAMANSAFPLIVQIRPSLNGVPNPSAVIASFALSFDNDPYTFSYESVKPNLTLPAGTYFVIFTTQTEEDIAGMLQTFPPYIAGTFPAGIVNLNTGESSFSDVATGAARILACALVTPTFDRCIQDE